MSRLAPKAETIRALFALSGNQCAFPGCTHALISDKGTFIAQLCHIEAANKGGQRFNDKQNDEERRSITNLLLLCYPHHRETDDETEFTVAKLKEIKKVHEKLFQQQYQLPENLLKKVTASIEIYLEQIMAVSKDTNTTVHNIDDKMNELLSRTAPQPNFDEEKYYISQLDSIKELKRLGKYKTAIDLLLDFKKKNWDKLNPETKYKVVVNLGMCYLDLHEKAKATEYLLALKDIPFESADSLAILCLGYAIAGQHQEFDTCFEKAVKDESENINLWVAYIERHKKEKTAGQILIELPAAISETIPVLFSIGGMLIEEGQKKEGIALLKKTLDKQEGSPEKRSDTKGLIATRILQDQLDIFKYYYNNYSAEELETLEDAKQLLTEAWEVIGDTELAKFKWYIILNRGVINKITGHKDQALLDFQKAFDLSKEFLPFKNLLFMQMQVNNLPVAEKLLSEHFFVRPLNEEEEFEIETSKARLLCLQGKFRDAILVMSALLDENDEKEYIEIITHIIAICLENNGIEEATPWCELLITKFPSLATGYLFCGFLWKRKDDKEKALENYNKAASLLAKSTSSNEAYELATGYTDLEEYEKAIPLFERLANKNILNSFSRGLIHVYYQSGDLQAALAIAENLFSSHPEHTYLAEIISNIYQETKQYDKAIAVIEAYLLTAKGYEKDVFSFRCARLYSFKRDWNNTLQYALAVQHPEKFSLSDTFILAMLLVKAGEVENGMAIAFDARTRFFDESKAHLNYTNIILAIDKPVEDLFPSIVRSECAVIIKIESGEEKTFLITDKNAKGENVLRPGDAFALQLIGKSKDQQITINKGFGFSYTVSIIGILDIYTHAFRESMRLFETRFAGLHNIGVLHANPGQPDDEMEQFIKATTMDKNNFQKQVYELYSQRKATIGVLACLFKRNAVMQWFALLSSPDISVISFSQNEYPAVEFAVTSNKPLIIDLTALLTMFFISGDTNFFSHLSNECIVSQSTLDELQECYEDMENSAKDGMFTMSYEDGRLVGHNTPKETIQRHREILQTIIQWCKENSLVTTSNKLLQIKREERERMSETLGDCFYDTILLAEEHEGIVIADDDNFKNLLRTSNNGAPFSTYQLVQWLASKDRVTTESFELFTMQLILSNHICIPLTGAQLWQSFDATGFQLGKPFTIAVNGLMVMRPEFCAMHLTHFLKKLYLETGLITTKEQTILFILNQISKRNDFVTLKKNLTLTIEKEFRLIPNFKDDIFQILNLF